MTIESAYLILLASLAAFFAARWAIDRLIDWQSWRRRRREYQEWSRKYGKGPHGD